MERDFRIAPGITSKPYLTDYGRFADNSGANRRGASIEPKS